MEFKETKIGLVPNDWEVKKLGEIGKIVGGGTPSTKNTEYWRGDIPWISSSDLIENSITYINIHRFINEEAIKQSATKLIPKNSILIVSRVGVGKVAINKTELCTSQDFQSFIPQIDINITYLAYYIHKNIKQLIRFNQGTSIKGITKKDIENFLIPIPPLKEQQKIAKILLTCDEMIEKQEKLIKEKEKLKKGLMQKLLKVEVNKELKKLPKVRFKEFSGEQKNGEWVEKKLNDIIIENKKSSHNVNSNIKNGKYIFFTSGDLTYKSNTYLVDGENLFIADGGEFNIKYYVGRADYSNHVYSIKIKSNSSLFLFYKLSFLAKKITIKCFQGSGLKNLDKKGFKRLKLYIPPTLKEQEKIADVLSTLDKEIDLLKLELEEFKKLKKSLMQKLLTGRVRV